MAPPTTHHYLVRHAHAGRPFLVFDLFIRVIVIVPIVVVAVKWVDWVSIQRNDAIWHPHLCTDVGCKRRVVILGLNIIVLGW